jgi:hypothetical protein
LQNEFRGGHHAGRPVTPLNPHWHWVLSIVAISTRGLALVGLYGDCEPLAWSEELAFSGPTVIRFAEVREGIEALTRRDDYIQQMSPFDRQVRLKTDREVSEQELLDMIAQNVLPWQPAEIERLMPMIEALAAKLASWKPPLPPRVLLVKTSGREESGAAYCRGAAIVLPQNMIDGDPSKLASVLAHETFHVISSHHPRLREALYAAIGFRPCNEVPLPEPLTARKITNPDAPVNRYYFSAPWEGRPVDLMPVLFSKSDRYDAARGGTLFSYLEFKLMVLAGEGHERRAALADGRPILLDPANVPGFAEQVGRNTRYTIHPEEILADNFVFLLNGRIDLPSPGVIQQMGRVLQQYAGEPR